MNDAILKPFSLPRLKIAETLAVGGQIILDKKQSHYLINVLRLRAGDFCRVFNAKDGEFLAKIDVSGKSAGLVIEDLLKPSEENPTKTILLISLIKKPRFQILIEKAVELGATHLMPVICERTVFRKYDDQKLQAWVDEALEQSERLMDPVLLPQKSLPEILAHWDKMSQDIAESSVTLYACVERGSGAKLADTYKGGNSAFLVGPEGGFSPAEVEAISNCVHTREVTLGPAVLRCETAALACLSHAMLSQI